MKWKRGGRDERRPHYDVDPPLFACSRVHGSWCFMWHCNFHVCKAAQPRSSEKNAASRVGQPPCGRWAVAVCYTKEITLVTAWNARRLDDYEHIPGRGLVFYHGKFVAKVPLFAPFSHKASSPPFQTKTTRKHATQNTRNPSKTHTKISKQKGIYSSSQKHFLAFLFVPLV